MYMSNLLRCGHCGFINKTDELIKQQNSIVQCINCNHYIWVKGERLSTKSYLEIDSTVKEFLNSFIYQSHIYLKLNNARIFALLGYPSLFISTDKLDNSYCHKYR